MQSQQSPSASNRWVIAGLIVAAIVLTIGYLAASRHATPPVPPPPPPPPPSVQAPDPLPPVSDTQPPDPVPPVAANPAPLPAEHPDMVAQRQAFLPYPQYHYRANTKNRYYPLRPLTDGRMLAVQPPGKVLVAVDLATGDAEPYLPQPEEPLFYADHFNIRQAPGGYWRINRLRDGISVSLRTPAGEREFPIVSNQGTWKTYFQVDSQGRLWCDLCIGVLFCVSPDGVTEYPYAERLGAKPDSKEYYAPWKLHETTAGDLIFVQDLQRPGYPQVVPAVLRLRGDAMTRIPLKPKWVGGSALDGDDHLWLLTRDGLYRMALADGSVRRIAEPPQRTDMADLKNPLELLRLPDGTLVSLWAPAISRNSRGPLRPDGTLLSIAEFAANSWRVVDHPTEHEVWDPQNGQGFRPMLVDRRGGAWISTHDRGLLYRQPDGVWRTIDWRHGVFTSGQSHLYPMPDDRIAVIDHGLTVIDPEHVPDDPATRWRYQFSRQWPSMTLDGSIWVATYSDGPCLERHHSRGVDRFPLTNTMRPEDVFEILEDSEGGVWIEAYQSMATAYWHPDKGLTVKGCAANADMTYLPEKRTTLFHPDENSAPSCNLEMLITQHMPKPEGFRIIGRRTESRYHFGPNGHAVGNDLFYDGKHWWGISWYDLDGNAIRPLDRRDTVHPPFFHAGKVYCQVGDQLYVMTENLHVDILQFDSAELIHRSKSVSSSEGTVFYATPWFWKASQDPVTHPFPTGGVDVPYQRTLAERLGQVTPRSKTSSDGYREWRIDRDRFQVNGAGGWRDLTDKLTPLSNGANGVLYYMPHGELWIRSGDGFWVYTPPALPLDIGELPALLTIAADTVVDLPVTTSLEADGLTLRYRFDGGPWSEPLAAGPFRPALPDYSPQLMTVEYSHAALSHASARYIDLRVSAPHLPAEAPQPPPKAPPVATVRRAPPPPPAAPAKPEPPAPDIAVLRQLVQQLGAAAYTERRAAREALLAHGRHAIPALRETADSQDPELRLAAAEIIAELEKPSRR